MFLDILQNVQYDILQNFHKNIEHTAAYDQHDRHTECMEYENMMHEKFTWNARNWTR